jgi:AbiV family abortive infection protein
MRLKDRRLPTREEAAKGIPVVLKNARAQIDRAALLADQGSFGPAVSFLILAIEETEKARTLGQMVLGEKLDETELRTRLFTHPSRYEGALWKSWSQGPLLHLALESIREEYGLKPARSDDERLADVVAQHPEALPMDWAEKAGPMREAGFYVDLSEDGEWKSPSDVDRKTYDGLRTAALSHLEYVEAPYKREIPQVNPS